MTQTARVRPPLEEALESQLLAERGLPALAHLLLLGLVFFLIWGALPPTLAGAWAGAVTLGVVVRTALWARAPRWGLSHSATVRLARVTMLALGLAWGLGTAFALSYLPTADWSLILLGLAGLLAGAITTLVADRWAYPIHAVATFGPILVAIQLQGANRLDEVAIGLIGLFLVFTIRLHQRGHDMLQRRLRAEDDLRNRERQLAAAQEIANVGSWEWNLETNTVIWSDQMRLIFGLPLDAPASFAGYLDRLHPDDRSRIQATIAASVAECRPMDYDWRTIRPDGEERLIHTRNMLVTDASGRVVRMLGIALDITERARAEENQRTLLRELQASVAEVKVLKGILPICASCKRIKNDDGDWEAVESFVRDRTNAEFTHGLCTDCAARDWGSLPGTPRT